MADLVAGFTAASSRVVRSASQCFLRLKSGMYINHIRTVHDAIPKRILIVGPKCTANNRVIL